jgi:hypothetical protein
MIHKLWIIITKKALKTWLAISLASQNSLTVRLAKTFFLYHIWPMQHLAVPLVIYMKRFLYTKHSLCTKFLKHPNKYRQYPTVILSRPGTVPCPNFPTLREVCGVTSGVLCVPRDFFTGSLVPCDVLLPRACTKAKSFLSSEYTSTANCSATFLTISPKSGTPSPASEIDPKFEKSCPCWSSSPGLAKAAFHW